MGTDLADAHELLAIIARKGIKSTLSALKEPQIPSEEKEPKTPRLNLYRVVSENCNCLRCYHGLSHNTRMPWRISLYNENNLGNMVELRHALRPSFRPRTSVSFKIEDYMRDTLSSNAGYIYNKDWVEPPTQDLEKKTKKKKKKGKKGKEGKKKKKKKKK